MIYNYCNWAESMFTINTVPQLISYISAYFTFRKPPKTTPNLQVGLWICWSPASCRWSAAGAACRSGLHPPSPWSLWRSGQWCCVLIIRDGFNTQLGVPLYPSKKGCFISVYECELKWRGALAQWHNVSIRSGRHKTQLLSPTNVHGWMYAKPTTDKQTCYWIHSTKHCFNAMRLSYFYVLLPSSYWVTLYTGAMQGYSDNAFMHYRATTLMSTVQMSLKV